MKNFIKIIIGTGLILFLQTCLVAQTITWNNLNGIPGPSILGQTADGILYAVSGTRIYTSPDAGINWVQPTPFAGTVEEFHANGNRLLASRNLSSHYNHEVFTSTNDGSSWTTIFYEAVPQFSSGFRQFLQTDSGALYAFHVVTSVASMLYKFQSGSFVQIGTAVPLVGAGNSGVGFTFPTPPEISLIDHANTIYAGTHAGGLYLTRDFGTTWTQVLPNAVSAYYFRSGKFRHCCRRFHAKSFWRCFYNFRSRCNMEKPRNAGNSIHFHFFGYYREHSRIHGSGKLFFYLH